MTIGRKGPARGVAGDGMSRSRRPHPAGSRPVSVRSAGPRSIVRSPMGRADLTRVRGGAPGGDSGRVSSRILEWGDRRSRRPVRPRRETRHQQAVQFGLIFRGQDETCITRMTPLRHQIIEPSLLRLGEESIGGEAILVDLRIGYRASAGSSPQSRPAAAMGQGGLAAEPSAEVVGESPGNRRIGDRGPWPGPSGRWPPGRAGPWARRSAARAARGGSRGTGHTTAARRTAAGRRAARRRPRPGCIDRWPARDRPAAPFGLLGGDVRRRAQDRAGRERELVGVGAVGDAEVHQVHVAAVVDPDVGRLDVPVHDPQGVGIRQGLGQLGDHARGVAGRQRAVLASRSARLRPSISAMAM